MILNALIRNPNVPNATKGIMINIQKNPGRGAKLEELMPRKRLSDTVSVIQHDGFSASIKIGVSLHPLWTKERGQDPRVYLERLAADLGTHSQYLQNRDLALLGQGATIGVKARENASPEQMVVPLEIQIPDGFR